MLKPFADMERAGLEPATPSLQIQLGVGLGGWVSSVLVQETRRFGRGAVVGVSQGEPA